MGKTIKAVFISCFCIYLADIFFLAVNSMLIDCLFCILLPFASIGALKAYEHRTDQQKEKENIAWLSIGISAGILSLMLLYISLGYEDELILTIMKISALVIAGILFMIIRTVKSK